MKIAIPNLGFRFDPQTGKPVYFLTPKFFEELEAVEGVLRSLKPVETAPLGTAPVNNTVRRLRWLRKRDELERNPNAHFPITLYI